MRNGLHPTQGAGPYLSANISLVNISQLYDFVKKNDKGFTPGKEVNEKLFNKADNKPNNII